MADDVQDPGPVAPDRSDWTWVLDKRCPDCGFDASRVRPQELPTIVRDARPRFVAVLGRADVRDRPSANTWSALEYGGHVRDMSQVMTERLEQILAAGGELVQFADWDQNEAASTQQYWRADPVAVSRQLTESLDRAADLYAGPTEEQWAWPARRSDGTRFTAGTLAQYFLHELTHHLWDVRG
ncbi:MAG TPA: DinB family protein [Segeticoccus sp.]|uniref:DinB family protein n=1 Tax=Segeticoccus sp. TaxID=2706531 RepID=UPI002D7FE8B2|nr:DinB family protein [Segeticoccus sp.]HET8600142.1 DinB family protein [Segeticoccus sp.]